MIVDILPYEYEHIAHKFKFHPWQKGLLGDLMNWRNIVSGNIGLNLSKHIIKTMNMGPTAGHTYFAKVAARRDFPIKTKVFAMSQKHLAEYAELIIDPNKCDEIVDVFSHDNFDGYKGPPVELIVIDLNNNPVGVFMSSLRALCDSVPVRSVILILEPRLWK